MQATPPEERGARIFFISNGIEYDNERECFYVEGMDVYEGEDEAARTIEATAWVGLFHSSRTAARVMEEWAQYILEGRQAGKTDREIAESVPTAMMRAAEAQNGFRGWLARVLGREPAVFPGK